MNFKPPAPATGRADNEKGNKMKSRLTIKLSEFVEAVKKNPEVFPKGMDTQVEDVKDFIFKTDIDKAVARLDDKVAAFKKLVLRRSASKQADVENACGDVRQAVSAAEDIWYEDFTTSTGN